MKNDDDLREIFLQRPTRRETDFEFVGDDIEEQEEDVGSEGTEVDLADFESEDEREEEEEELMEEDLEFVAADDSE